MFSAKCVFGVLMVVSLVVLASCRPQEYDEDDHDGRASNRNDDVARVQIKVYRGPTTHDGHAPWGFWVKQPTDDE